MTGWLWAVGWMACSSGPAPEEEPAAEEAARAPAPDAVNAEEADESVPLVYPRPTTRGRLARETLDGQIAAFEEALPRRPATRPQLMRALALRSSLFGRVSDLDRMLEVSEGTEEEGRAWMAVHRFDAALAADPSLKPSIDLARHDDLEALATERRAAVEERPSTDAWVALGDVLLAMGEAQEADEAYGRALLAYRDVSPLTVADLQFRRGLAWGESGEDPERARALYGDAVQRLPGFVRAHVHLAELEFEAGERDQAIARVRRVAKAEDPEPGGKLAQWLPEPEATEWREKTTAAYDALLARHPLAFANHAAEYFRAIGEVDRARELAEMDLANRDTPRARELCAELDCEGGE